MPNKMCNYFFDNNVCLKILYVKYGVRYLESIIFVTKRFLLKILFCKMFFFIMAKGNNFTKVC